MSMSMSPSASASPVLFRSAVVNNPPRSLAQDGVPGWEFRQDRGGDSVHFHVIVSIAAGTGRAENVWLQLVKGCLDCLHIEAGRDYVLHRTTSETSISDFTRDVLLPRANLGVRQSVLLLSGDGGVVDIVNGLRSGPRARQYTRPSISLLPLGTGNALAHSAGITSDHDNCLGLRTWLRGGPKELPLFRATFSPGSRQLVDEARRERPLHMVDGVAVCHGCVVASWGLHAGLVADSDTVEFRAFGVERFQIAAKAALFPSDGSPPHVYRASVSVQRPGQRGWHAIRDGQHAYVLATLCRLLENRFTISPASQPLDGKLRLLHFGPVSGEHAMAIMGDAYRDGRHVDDDCVGYEEIVAVRIDFDEEEDRWRRVCVDGNIIRVERDGWMEVRAGQQAVVDLIVSKTVVPP